MNRCTYSPGRESTYHQGQSSARQLTAAEAIRSLQVDEYDNSCNENEDITTRLVMQATLENSDLLVWTVNNQFLKILMRYNFQSFNGTLFQVEPAFCGNKSTIWQTEEELQLEIFFLKDWDQHHIL